jgi:pSer/pThr/pTyr-binding forkhead associated (FHA) protein
MITCNVCNSQNPDGTQYCQDCGAELVASTPAPVEAAIPQETPAIQEPTTPITPEPVETEAAATTEPIETPASPPASDTALTPAKLIFKRFGALGDEVPLQGPLLTVGRFDASTGPVEIDLTGVAGAENISRRHAEVFFDGGWKVRDLGSTNGVFVKKPGETAYSPRITEAVALADGYELAFGNIIMVFKDS